MDWKVTRLNQELRGHDPRLFACRLNTGMIQIWRKADRLQAADLEYDETGLSIPMQLICALTNTWDVTGKPVDWGIEPVMSMLHELDSWGKEGILDGLRRSRERAKAIREQRTRNEIRARAADLRKEFAKATNDINTSTLEKVDRRRLKNGYCK